MYAWEKAFEKFLEVVHSEEIKQNIKLSTYNIMSFTISNCSALTGSFFIFMMSYCHNNLYD